MHLAIKNLNLDISNYKILVDGNNFKPYMLFKNNEYQQIPAQCIIKGDNQYVTIAAASIVAKVERDNYIKTLCLKFPKLNEYYDLLKNKGYGTKSHIEGIKKYGITQFHRTTFKQCKNIIKNDLE